MHKSTEVRVAKVVQHAETVLLFAILIGCIGLLGWGLLSMIPEEAWLPLGLLIFGVAVLALIGTLASKLHVWADKVLEEEKNNV